VQLVKLALIPEAIAFFIIAESISKLALCLFALSAVGDSICRGRPISEATGAMALVMIHLVKDHGVPICCHDRRELFRFFLVSASWVAR